MAQWTLLPVGVLCACCLPALADAPGVSINVVTSKLSYNVTAQDLSGVNKPNSDNFHITGTLNTNTGSQTGPVHAFLDKAIVTMTKGSSQFTVNISGTFGTQPASTSPVSVTLSSRSAPFDLTGDLNETSLNMSVVPGVYTGTLTITATDP